MLVSVDEFKDSIHWESQKNWTDAQVLQALAFADGRFYRLTHRKRLGYWLEPVEATLNLYGTGLAKVRCPFPVLSLSSVTVDEVDVTENARFKGHYLSLSTGLFTASETVPNIVVTGTFGDPSLAGDDVPGDVVECIMRMAWHYLRKERLIAVRTTSRVSVSAPPPVDMGSDAMIKEAIESYSIEDITRTFDFR